MTLASGLLRSTGLRLARPEALFPALVVLAALGALALMRRRRYCAHSLAHLAVFASMRPSPLRHLPRLLWAAGLALATVALLDPRLVSRERVTRIEALEVALVVDVSLSMKEPIGGLYERPVYAFSGPAEKRSAGPRPPRIQVMRSVLSQIIDRRPDDRLALIVFSEHGYVVTPPTTDHAYLRQYLSMVDPDLVKGEGQTAIGEGVATALGVFESSESAEGAAPARGRAIVVFTDGENNAGRDPTTLVDAARRRGYRVYLIAMDLPDGIERKPAQAQLVRAVEQSGGRYYDARSEIEVARASAAIDRLERGVFTDRTIEHDVPLFHLFALASAAVSCAGIVLSAIPFFIDVT